ncbi:uncharacterized protein LOC125673437 isoform X2 [Ostrea edulis]|uniref:uncharacterized protein LOC125673437 isoform X2 n=1 Tax=Ostrea edulis TaxID=37623 RepID=UPI0024AFA1DB|nr:uncharacterized protein LOC125673437 isoform X2 [Ostrea edulis]
MDSIHIVFLVLATCIPIHVKGFVCENSTYCMTSLIIENAFTMIDPTSGPLYVDDRSLYPIDGGEAVNISNVISADGWNKTRRLVTANGTMPGPPIYLYQNQRITVIVTNNLINEAVTIHWHGIDQLGWPAMDGVAFVTQCPILPGQSFNYTFQPRFSGTYWYHSHVGNQRDMGMYGAFIVLKRNNEIPISRQHIIQLQEWNHLYDPVTLLRAKLNGKDKEGVSILINGRGDFDNNVAPLASFVVDKGENYKFRLIGVGSKDTFLFSVPGLRLIVKETDGYEFEKRTVDRIIIYPAERYDFELDLSYASEGIYNITVYILQGSDLKVQDKLVGRGHINVTNKYSLRVTMLNRNTEVILNCPFQEYPPYPNFTCLPVSELKSNISDDGLQFGLSLIQKTDKTYTHFLNFGFPKYSSINGRKFIWPKVSALSQPSEVDTTCAGCDDETSCECSHTLDLPSGSENIMILSNLGTGMVISHPIHMHGHTYEVLKMGFPSFDSSGILIPNEDIMCSESKQNNASQCNNARWRNPAWNDYTKIPGVNLIDPVRKDTVVVPVGGYTIIRIRATNPGVWFMHCHIDPHMVFGMALMLNESFEYVKDLPMGLPSCHSFTNRGSPAEAQQQQQTPVNSETSTIALGVAVAILGTALIVTLSVHFNLRRRTQGGNNMEQQEMQETSASRT